MPAVIAAVRLIWLAIRAFFVTFPAWVMLAWNMFAAYRAFTLALKLALITTVLYLLPVPQFLQDLPTHVASLPAGFWWFADTVKLGAGVGIVVTAMVYRFVARRIVHSMES